MLPEASREEDGINRARHFRVIKVSTTTASIPLSTTSTDFKTAGPDQRGLLRSVAGVAALLQAEAGNGLQKRRYRPEPKGQGLTSTPQCSSFKGLMVFIRWYLGSLKG